MEKYFGNEAEKFFFYAMPKQLITDPVYKDLSYGAKIMYAVLHDRMSLSIKSHWVDEENAVYILYSSSKLEADMGCSKNSRIKYMEELENFGLISTKKEQGKPTRIYVHKFEVIHTTGSEIELVQNLNQFKNSTEPVQNLNPNYTNNNDTYNDLINTTTTITVDESEMKEKFHLDYHRQYDGDYQIYASLFKKLISILSGGETYINVHGSLIDKERAINHLSSISEDDLDYAATCIKRYKKPIINTSAFYTTVLWDSVGNGESGMQNLARSDWQL